MTADPHRDVLDALAARGRLRALAPRAGLDFTSNDYLALAESPLLREAAADALAISGCQWPHEVAGDLK